METIKINRISKFFPYESVHAIDNFIVIKDTDMRWKDAIIEALKKYEIVEYYNCTPGYFHLTFDNKITLELQYNEFVNVYLTWWDNTVYIGFSNQTMKFNKEPRFVTIKHI